MQEAALRVLASVFILFVGIVLPWFVTLAVAGVVLLFKAASFEIIFIGAILDVMLLTPQDGLAGFFFTPLFFVFFVITELTSKLLRNDE